MELKVGMYYTRTNDGKLGLCKCENMTPKQYVETYKDIYNIKNASHNIIDLIEEGDYVNGHLVTGFNYKGTTKKKEVYSDVRLSGGGTIIKEKDIKSIVTKEQFSQMQYKVGD